MLSCVSRYYATICSSGPDRSWDKGSFDVVILMGSHITLRRSKDFEFSLCVGFELHTIQERFESRYRSAICSTSWDRFSEIGSLDVVLFQGFRTILRHYKDREGALSAIFELWTRQWSCESRSYDATTSTNQGTSSENWSLEYVTSGGFFISLSTVLLIKGFLWVLDLSPQRYEFTLQLSKRRHLLYWRR